MQLQSKANRHKAQLSKPAATSCLQTHTQTRFMAMDSAVKLYVIICCFICINCFLWRLALCYPSKAEALLLPTMPSFVPLMPLILILIRGRPIINILVPGRHTHVPQPMM